MSAEVQPEFSSKEVPSPVDFFNKMCVKVHLGVQDCIGQFKAHTLEKVIDTTELVLIPVLTGSLMGLAYNALGGEFNKAVLSAGVAGTCVLFLDIIDFYRKHQKEAVVKKPTLDSIVEEFQLAKISPNPARRENFLKYYGAPSLN